MFFSKRERRLSYCFFFVVIAAAMFFRLYGIDDYSLWLDELKVVEIIRAHGSLWEVIKHLFYNETHVPFYYIVEYFNIRLFGRSDFVVRLPSFLFSIMSFWELALLSRSNFDRRNILIFFILAAVSPLIITYSRDAMMYSMLFWGSCRLLRYWFLLEKSPEHLRVTLEYILITVVVVYTHYYGILLAGSLFAIALFPWFRTFSLKRHVLIHLPLVVCISFWLIPFVKGLGYSFWWQEKSGTASFYDLVYATSTTVYMFMFYLSLIIFAIAVAWKKRESIWLKRALFLALLVVIPTITTFLKSILLSPSVQAKYLLIITAPFIVLVGMCIPRVVRDRLLFYLTSLVIFLVLCLETVSNWGSYKKSLSRLITERIVQEYADNLGSVILTRGLYPLYFPQSVQTYFYRHNAYDFKDKNLDILQYENGYDTIVFGYELKEPSDKFYKLISSKYDLCAQYPYWSYGEPAGVQVWKKKCY